jgi:hypothetical protein
MTTGMQRTIVRKAKPCSVCKVEIGMKAVIIHYFPVWHGKTSVQAAVLPVGYFGDNPASGSKRERYKRVSMNSEPFPSKRVAQSRRDCAHTGTFRLAHRF